jgi:hypothetical protein
MIPGGYLELSIMGEQTMSSFTRKQTRASITFFIKPNGCFTFHIGASKYTKEFDPRALRCMVTQNVFFSPP